MKYFSTVLGIWGLDLLTKKCVDACLPVNKKKEVIKNKFYLHHIKNSGMAYNLCEQNPKRVLQTAGGITAFCFFSLLYYIKKKDSRAMPCAMILGGALGNLAERVWKGKVTDFLYLNIKHAPIFNFADIAVVGGTLLLAKKELQNKS